MTNLKVDIIYYKTSSDFELEFNLTGCCRMRLFKDKIDERKELVSALARDVSRSRIILIVSDLYGDKNGAETISAAIGYKYVSIDKTAHSIKSDEDIYVPTGALPLVTKSGQFGGFIIECGKQSIIVVSSDRTLRHEIMRSFIHQYIFDINQVEAYNERLRHESENNPIIDNSNILIAARKEFTHEMPKVDTNTLNNAEGVPVTAPEGVVVPDELVSVETEKADAEEDCSSSENTDESAINCDDENVCAEENLSAENNADDLTDIATDDNVAENGQAAEKESADRGNSVTQHTDGFEIPHEVLSEFDSNEKKVNRKIMRRRKGGDILLLIIAILLLLGFGLLAYFLVYLPLITGEMPNSLSQILEAIL